MGTGAAYLARVEGRRRWRDVVLLTLLVTLVVATVLTSLAGARRTRVAFDRYLEDIRPFDGAIVGSDPGLQAALDGSPLVEQSVVGHAQAAFPGDAFVPMVSFEGGVVPYERFRFPVVEGRRPGRDEPLEVALGERTSALLGKGVGDRIELQSFSPEAARAVFDAGEDRPPDGPRIVLDVVGIVRDPGDIAARADDLTFTMLTPAFAERYRGEVGSIGGFTFVDLAPGATEQDLADLLEDAVGPNVEIDPLLSRAQVRAQADPTVAALSTGLYLFAVVAGLAGLVAVAQAAVRTASTAAVDDASLLALGVGRGVRTLRLVLPTALALVVGTVLGAVVSVVASPLHPIGLARRAEPDLGVSVDGTVLALGVAGFLVVGAVVLVAAVRLLRVRTRTERVGRVAALATASGLRPSVAAGLHLATVRGVGPRATPVRAAVTAAFVGTTGVLAALVFAASLDRLVESPRLYGWGWDAQLAGSEGSQVSDGAVDEENLVADDDLSAVAEVVFAFQVQIDRTPVQVIVIDQRKGETTPIIVRGDAPVADDQIAIGGETIERLDRDVGDTVEVRTAEGERQMRIVGVAALPVPSDGGLSAEGGVLTIDGALAVGYAGSCEGDVSCYRNYAVTVRPGVDVDSALRGYADEEAGVAVDRPVAPGEVQQLAAVDRLPWILAGFLALLGLASVGHAAWMTVRRRRRDLALLRTLGFTAGQLRVAVVVQVAVLVMAGAAAGVLAGVVAGRQVWRLVVDQVSLPYAPAVPWIAMVAVPLCGLVLAEVLASLPRRTAARLKAGEVLRAE